MFIAKVVGRTWATRKQAKLEKHKLLLVVPIEPLSGKECGKVQLALDPKVDAGVGDCVLVIDEGNSARQVLDDKTAPIRTVIVGIVDAVQSGDSYIKFH
ncbi:MAG: hypothetical protein COS94_01710 [Candidatus Hydrogenedentes bacterium CG07_land_8_20_14_0_80_42_17]|nr:MAG: hypothetical protein COS94_01710 [Candidatus Hydrogenedentes bacterium CG07_land_8_20_14_0_80_42_17]